VDIRGEARPPLDAVLTLPVDVTDFGILDPELVDCWCSFGRRLALLIMGLAVADVEFAVCVLLP